MTHRCGCAGEFLCCCIDLLLRFVAGCHWLCGCIGEFVWWMRVLVVIL
ncbi:MAG: hypothetical protein J6C50_04275 [Rickettsiales bacterium]|nr:hypothetical protein [Rickettsiales bacterium]